MPLEELHYVTGHQFDSGQKGSKINNLALASLAFFLLIISMANYINLSTALLIKRKKELSVRRIMGEGKSLQQMQLFFEAAFLMIVSLLLLTLLTYFLLPVAENLTDLRLRIDWLAGPGLYLSMMALGLLLTILSSIYPLLSASRQPLIHDLKGMSTGRYGWGLRYSLLAAQLVVSVGFAVIALGMDEQLRYVANKDLGFEKENVLTLPLGVEINDKAELIREKLSQLPFVKAVTISITPISGDQVRANFGLVDDSTGTTHLMNANYVDHNFLQVYGVRLLAGRAFDETFSSDVLSAYILNEKAVELLGFAEPAAALNQRFGKETRDSLQTGSIVGVVDNYHFLPLYREVEPMVWQVNPYAPKNLLALRVAGGNYELQIRELQKAMNELGIEQGLDFPLLTDTLEIAYNEDNRLALFIKVCTGVIVFIAMLGVFSLAAFILESRRKEVGIRKLLGANLVQLLWVFSKAFAVCLLIGLVLGGVASGYFLQTWLNEFAYHLEVAFWYAPAAGLAMALLMLLTVYGKVSKAANTNPAEVLREE